MSALADFETSLEFTDREKLVLRYAEKLTVTPVEISEEFFDQLRREFSDQQLVDLTSSIAWENYRARFNHAFGIESANFCELPTPVSRAHQNLCEKPPPLRARLW